MEGGCKDTILYKGFEHPQIFVSSGLPVPYGYRGMTILLKFFQ